MGANMGKQPAYSYGFPPRRRASHTGSANDFSKDFWGPTGASESPGKQPSSEFWAVDSERRYRQEVFDRESENFYPSASTYRAQSTFESPFTFTNSVIGSSKSKPSSGSPKDKNSRHAYPSVPPPYTSRSSNQSSIRAGEPKYLPRCVAGI